VNAELYFDDKRPITDDDLKHFEDPALAIQMLAIYGPSFTDDRLDKLTRLPFAQKLVHFGLTGTSVTDDGLMHLVRCKNLGGIGLARADHTPAGVRRLADALPATCSIVWYSKADGSKPEPIKP
jgi:hypothetical protein